MDNATFDRLTKILSSAPTRRATLGLLVGAAASSFAGLVESAAAKSKKKGKGKRKKKRKTPRGERCGSAVCRLNESCCGGRCVDPFLCCQTTEECNGCQACVEGVCETDPSRNGVRCSDCLVCVDGACEVPNDEFCQDHELCRPDNGRCCARCLNGQCCEIGEVCINPGPSGEKSCCSTARNEPCGANGDGTYRACCESGIEECVQGTCELKIPCPGGSWTAQGLCCQNGQSACNGACCEPGRCTAAGCCPRELEICGDDCCEDDETCCGGICCRRSNCINGSCCEDPCGDIGASTRVCPTAQETCCQTADDATDAGNRGFACPASAPRCGGVGTCCPVDKFFSPSCNACCPTNDFQCRDCVGTVPGRT